MFKENFVRLCNQRGVAPTAVCVAIGLQKSAFSNWDETSVPRQSTLVKLADYFNVSVDYLLGKDEPPTNKKVLKVPVYGKIAAGVPIEAIEDIEDYEELNPENYAPGDYIALKIQGQSMEPRMMSGDVVIVRLQDNVETGDTAVVLIEGSEATCKKIKKTPEGIYLLPTNPAYDPMFYSNEEIISLPVKVLGKVVELRAKY